jgi:hypothetical protein
MNVSTGHGHGRRRPAEGDAGEAGCHGGHEEQHPLAGPHPGGKSKT